MGGIKNDLPHKRTPARMIVRYCEKKLDLKKRRNIYLF